MPADNARARRALELIEAALGRLMALVDAAHKRDSAVADALERSADGSES